MSTVDEWVGNDEWVAMMQRSREQIPLSDGSALPLSVAAPESSVRGGILVGPGAHGVTEAVWQLAAGFASEGWLAVIPHLYHRDGVDELPEDDHVVDSHVGLLTAESIRADTGAALQWLASRGLPADRI